MYRRWVEHQGTGVAHAVDMLVLGVVLLQLDERVADHDVIVLISAYEAGEDNAAGESMSSIIIAHG